MVVVNLAADPEGAADRRPERDHRISVPLASKADPASEKSYLSSVREAILRASAQTNDLLTVEKDRIGELEKVKEKEWLERWEEEKRLKKSKPDGDDDESGEEEAEEEEE